MGHNMKRVLFAVLFTLVAVTGAWGQSFSGDASLLPGNPSCDVRAKGAKGDAVADDSPSFAACMAVLATTSSASGNGGILWVPPGNYCIKSATIDTTSVGAAVNIVGAGPGPSSLNACGTNITVVKLNTTRSNLENIQVVGDGINGGGGSGVVAAITVPAVIVDTACLQCKVSRAQIAGGTIPLLIKGADVIVDDVGVSGAYGTASVQITNPSVPIATHLIRPQFDTNMPTGVNPPLAAIPAWQALHAYVTNDVVSLNGFYIQAFAGGTSGASSPTLRAYSLPITDASVTWLLVGPTGLCGLSIESGASEVSLTDGDFSNAFGSASICMSNNLAGAAPSLVKINNSVVSNVLGPQTILLSAGTGFSIENSEILGCNSIAATCPGVNILSTFGGEANFTNNTFGGQFHGILAAAGKFNVIGNTFGSAVAGTNTIDVNVGAGVSNFTIVGNYCNTGSFNVNAGASNHYRIMANANCPATDAGTGTDRVVESVWTTYTPVATCAGGGAITATTSGRFQLLMSSTLQVAIAFKATSNTCVAFFRASLPTGYTSANGSPFYTCAAYNATLNNVPATKVTSNSVAIDFLTTPTSTDQFYANCTVEIQ
jgi:Pectate lyase superfamily protein